MIRTRFAPSPTGYLHIGGVRTALFCWLFARKHGGEFVLRIDDTDQQRNVEEALQPILDGLRWLGVDWDEGPEVGGPFGPYYQSQRGDLYRAAAEKLIETGFAYYDFATPAEVQAEREAAEKDKRTFVYSRRFIAETPQEKARFEAEGRSAVVRLKMPREGKLVIPDLVRGNVEFDWAQEQDHVVQRGDGSCLYHLASVVDDHAMEISHVIRAEEHLSNTPRQIFIAEALGYELPKYAHLPCVAEPGSKVKLSKRKLAKYLKNRDFAQLVEHGLAVAKKVGLTAEAEEFNPVIVDFYREVGYLPEAVVNYLALLGWSLDDKTEYFTKDELVTHFTLDRVNKAPASFDANKLQAFQERHMQALGDEEKLDAVMPFLERAGYLPAPATEQSRSRVRKILRAAADRIKVAGDVLDYPYFFVADDALEYDEAAFKKRIIKPRAAELLQKYRDSLAEMEAFNSAFLEGHLKAFVELHDLKVGDLIHAVRVAVTGTAVGCGLFETLEILGKESCLARLDAAIGKAS